MAILEVILEGRYFNQLTITRWNYVSGGVPAVVSRSFALAAAFGAVYDDVAIPAGYPVDTPLGQIAIMCGDGWDWQQLTVLNVYDPVDFYQAPFVVPYGGKASANNTTPINAYGFRTNVVRRDVARGTKRFPGVSEENSGEGGVIVPGFIATMNTVAAKMTEVLEYDDEGNTITFSPAVCGKDEYDPNAGNPLAKNHRAYKYYPDEATQMAHTAVGVIWQPYNTVRSQTSRQYNRGR